MLVADHDRKLVQKLCRFLSTRDYVAVGTSATAEALSMLAEHEPDIVLVDLGLEDGSALEVCYAARGHACAPKLIVLVPKGQHGESLNLLDHDDALQKPFSGRELLDSLAKVQKGPGVADRAPAIRKARSVERKRAGAPKPPPQRQERLEAVKIPGRTSVRPPEQFQLPDAKTRPTVVRGEGEMRTVMHNVGSLERTAFPALLYKLFANQATGMLTIHATGNERVIYFQHGEPVHATSPAASDSLGAILVNLGYMELPQLTAVLQTRREGQPLGQALIERNQVTAEQLLHALERQVYDRVLSVFSFTAGPYIFIEDTDWIGEVRQFPQNPIQLISDGVNRYVGPNVLAKHLEGHLKQFVVRTEKFDAFRGHFPVSAGTQEALVFIDGSRTLQGLATDVGGDLMSLLRLVWSLRLADMVDFLDTPRTTAERSADKPSIPSRPPTDHNLNRALLAKAAKMASESRVSASRGDGTGGLTAAGQALSQKVLEYYVRLGYEDSWQLLGLPRDADETQAKMAYRKAIDQLPKARFELLNETLKEKAREVHTALAKALATITDNKQRRSYERRLKRREEAAVQHRKRRKTQIQEGEERDRSMMAGRTEVSGMIDIWASGEEQHTARETPLEHGGGDADLEADQSGALVDERRARSFAQAGRWKDAYHAIKAALKIDPENPTLNIFFAWVVYNLPHEDKPRQRRVCRSRIDVQLQLDNCNVDGYFYLGRMCEDDRQFADALDYYRTAIALDKSHADANRAFERVSRHPALAESEPVSNEASGKIFGRLKALFGGKE